METITKKSKEEILHQCSLDSFGGVSYSHGNIIKAMDEWAKVSGIHWFEIAKDGLPPHNIGVLVFIPDEDNHITSGMWDVSNSWVLLDEYRVPECEVTHWMYLPEPPIKRQHVLLSTTPPK